MGPDIEPRRRVVIGSHYRSPALRRVLVTVTPFEWRYFGVVVVPAAEKVPDLVCEGMVRSRPLVNYDGKRRVGVGIDLRRVASADASSDQQEDQIGLLSVTVFMY